MFRFLVISLGLSGMLVGASCFGPRYPEGLSCDGPGDCPPEQRCFTGSCVVPEPCNGIDDDGDGQVDEGCDCLGESSQPCGIDMCVADGVQFCAGGIWGPCIGATQPSKEDCNGGDENCDGSVDDGCTCFDGEVEPCGVGLCARDGARTCTNGSWGACVGASGPSAEICGDGKDNDCDGSADEGCSSCAGSTQRSCGVCGDGLQTCSNGDWGPCVGATVPNPCCPGDTKTCGPIDPQGECRSGIESCTSSGTWSGICSGAKYPTTETCNNLDDDCDGQTDESDTCRCSLYVNSNYGTLCATISYDIMSNIPDLGGCNDKISSVICYNGTRIRLYIDKNYLGNSWLISGSVPTLNDTTLYGNLGDNASSAILSKP